MKHLPLIGRVVIVGAMVYGISLIRTIAVNTATIGDLLDQDFEDAQTWMCACDDDEVCDLCRLPADDEDFQLGDSDERTFLGIMQSLDEEDPDGE